ncbi:MAG: HAD family hydrolase [Planctomycetota bacterium]|nr:HAD family hydrolase [Planctomycetota bacterium]
MSDIEIIRPPGGRRLRAAVFDFDGTLSLIRTGWQDIMIPMMVEHLARLATGLAPERLRAMMVEDVAETTGMLTIVQMIRFAQRVAEFGGTPLDPKEYKAEYKRRLLVHIAARRTALVERSVTPDSLLVAGSRAMLEGLAARGLALCLASGSDEPEVREEAGLLDLARYFGNDIRRDGPHGAGGCVEARAAPQGRRRPRHPRFQVPQGTDGPLAGKVTIAGHLRGRDLR